ncbi:hypothetical protein HGA92_03965 [Candidatus Gracilibacteria bacterium]|nr:hypothetical protein [Candidatus Gracilibacteria bacterium]NUJ99254.1 hypothetical protein [Candidatus Gracilibacteria bacterium]
MFKNEKIIETKTCRHCGASFDITDKDLEFYEKISPVFPNPGVSFSTPGLKLLENGKIKYLIPPPTLCPDCRQQRRLSFRNERKLYKRKCDFSGKDIISIYFHDKPYKVYDQEIWWSDKWDALDYGKDFDFDRGFFNQFGLLYLDVPRVSIVGDGSGSVNSTYCQGSALLKDCYFVSTSWKSEKCLYAGNQCIANKYVVDSSYIQNSEQCYECIYGDSLYNCFYLIQSTGCSFCSYGIGLKGCSFCFGCVNLLNKKYCIFNKQYSESEYKDNISKIISEKYDIYKDFKDFSIKYPKLFANNIKCEGCIGDGLINSKNMNFCFDVVNGEDCKYVFEGVDIKDSYDLTYGGAPILAYDSMDPDGGYGILFSGVAWRCNNVIYSQDCFNSSNLFGCIGLRNKSYCILNKQYTKEEYEILVPKIIEHMMTPPKSPSIEGESGAIVKQGEQEWGEFFPSSLSPFGYNETVAQEYYPINPEVSKTGLEGEINYIDREGNTYNTLEEAGKRPVFKYSTYEAPFPKVEKIIPASKLPSNISEIPDDILNWAIECEVTKKPFKIIKEELAFYRKHNLPIPRRHPDQRHLDRMSLRNPRKLFERICDCLTCEENHKNIGKYKEEEFVINTKTGKKGKKIQTTYAPERQEIVYCEECYNKEVY